MVALAMDIHEAQGSLSTSSMWACLFPCTLWRVASRVHGEWRSLPVPRGFLSGELREMEIKLSLNYDNRKKAVTITAIVFLCAWNLIYLYAYYSMNTHTPIYIIVPFKTHYSPRHGDCVSFSYKGYKFYRKLRLRDMQSKYGENLTSKCNLELSLYKVDAFPYFYYINYIDIVEKNNYQ